MPDADTLLATLSQVANITAKGLHFYVVYATSHKADHTVSYRIILSPCNAFGKACLWVKCMYNCMCKVHAFIVSGAGEQLLHD